VQRVVLGSGVAPSIAMSISGLWTISTFLGYDIAFELPPGKPSNVVSIRKRGEKHGVLGAWNGGRFG